LLPNGNLVIYLNNTFNLGSFGSLGITQQEQFSRRARGGNDADACSRMR